MAKLDKLLKAGKKVVKETVSRAKKEAPELRAKLDKLKPKPKPKKEKTFLQRKKAKQNKKDALELGAIAGVGIPTATLMGIGIADRQEQRYKAADKLREKIKKKREAAKEKGDKTFTVDGLRYDTSTGRRKPLSAAPLLEATQRRIDYEKARDKKPVKKASGGMAVKSGSSRKSKPRGVGAALRGYGKALK